MRLMVQTALGFGVALACALTVQCNLFGNGDSPPPMLGPGGGLSALPCEVIFPVVAASVDGGAPTSVVTLYATTADGLGAESTAVEVALSPCADGGGAIQAGCAAGLGRAAGANIWSEIQLSAVGDGGCTAESPNDLSCVISGAGFAQFAISPTTPDFSTEGDYVPICVTTSGQSLVVPVLVQQSIDAGSLVLTPEDAGIRPSTTISPDCRPVACGGALTSLPMSLSLVDSNDSPFLAQTPVNAVLTLPNLTSVGLSPVGCGTLATTPLTSTLSVQITAGASSTPVFLCASPGTSASYQMTAAAVSQQNISQAYAQISVLPTPQSVSISLNDSDAGPPVVATVQDCTGAPIPVTDPIGVVGLNGSTVTSIVLTDAGSTAFGVLGTDAGTFVQFTMPFNAGTCVTQIGGGL